MRPTVLVRVWFFLLAGGLLFPQAPPQPALPFFTIAPPAASTAVESSLRNAEQFRMSAHFDHCLKASVAAAQLAADTGDQPGVAQAHAERARALSALGRQKDAIEAWQASASAWEAAHYLAGRVMALVEIAMLAPQDEAERLYIAALDAASAEPDRLVAAVALHDAGNRVAPNHPYHAEPFLNIRLESAPLRGPLNAADGWQEELEFAKAAEAASAALDLARKINDQPGVALAHAARARALDGLQRTGESRQAWKACAQAWAAAGYVPAQVRALLEAAAWTKDAEGEKEFAAALALARSFDKGPLLAALALYDGKELADLRDARVLPFLIEAKDIREKVAPNSRDMARTLRAIAYVRRHDKPEPLLIQALAIDRRNSPDSWDVGRGLVGLADAVSDDGRMNQAHQMLKEAERIADAIPEPAQAYRYQTFVYHFLAIEGMMRGDLAAARFYLERTLQRGIEVGAPRRRFGGTIINLGNVNMIAGEYEAALRNYQEALGIFPDSAGIMLNIGLVLQRIGDEEGARGRYREALELSRRHAIAFPGSVDYVTHLILEHQGEMAIEHHDYVAARKYSEDALARYDRVTPFLSVAFTNLVVIDRAEGRFDQAQARLDRHLEFLRKEMPDSIGEAGAEEEYGKLEVARGRPGRAREHFERAQKIREKLLGRSHPDTTNTLTYRALSLLQAGDEAGARDLAFDAADRVREAAESTLRYLSERQALELSSKLPRALDLLLTAAPRHQAGVISQLWDAGVRSRAMVLDEMAARHRVYAPAGDAVTNALSAKLRASGQWLATLTLQGANGQPREQYRELVNEARAQKEEVERALAARSASFRSERARASIGLDEVIEALPPNSALLAYFRYSPVDLAARDPLDRAKGARARYAAFTVSGRARATRLADLGDAAAIDHIVFEWRSQIAAQASSTLSSSVRAERLVRAAGLRLRARIWDPIAARIADSKLIFVVPDGDLNLVNFAALPAGDGYLIESGKVIHYLAAERDLVRGASSPGGRDMLALDSAAFDDRSLFARMPGDTVAQARPAGASGALFRGASPRCEEFRKTRFRALPGTASEVREVETLWRRSGQGEVIELHGAAASETEFKRQAAGKRVLHLATHAFVVPAACRDKTGTDNGLLLSGLALAGANNREAASAEEDDGILTAEEIGALNLEGTEWAVLSACETGVGQVRAGEGVLGLRRAFQVAGVKTVVMSLWPIDDNDTRAWMRHLYAERFANRRSSAEAVHKATLASLRERRAAGKSTHPFYWAAFIAAGDWR